MSRLFTEISGSVGKNFSKGVFDLLAVKHSIPQHWEHRCSKASALGIIAADAIQSLKQRFPNNPQDQKSEIRNQKEALQVLVRTGGGSAAVLCSVA